MSEPLPGHTGLNNTALALALALLAAAAACLPLLLRGEPAPPPKTALVVSFFSYDSTAQRAAHKLFLVLLAALGLLAQTLRRLTAGRAAAAANAFCARLRNPPVWALLLALPVLVIPALGTGRDQYLLGAALFLAAYLSGARRADARPLRLFAGAAIAALCLGLLLPGFLYPKDYRGMFEVVLWHYYALFGEVPLLAAGRDIFANVTMCYGTLPQTILAILQRGRAPFAFSDYAVIVMASQALFTALALCAYRILTRGRPLVLLFCLLLWLPWLSTCGGSIGAPTQSGLRFLFFAAAPLALLLSQDATPRLQAALCGLTAGLALLHNFETGVCILIGLLGHTVVSEKWPRLGRIAANLLVFLLGLGAAAGLFALLFRAGLGRWPAVHIQALADFLRQQAVSFTGARLFYDPRVLLLLLWPGFLLLRLTLAWFGRGLAPRMRFSFAICIILLIWFAYYFNRPHNWNLWTHLFLASFLIPGALRLPRLSRAGGLRGMLAQRAPLLPFLILLVLGPQAVNTGLSECKATARNFASNRQLARDHAGMELYSGTWFPAACAGDMREKSSALAALPQGSAIFIAGGNQMLLQWEHGIMFDLPFQDLFLDSQTDEELLRNVQAIRRAGPERILLDAQPGCTDAPPGKQRMIQALPGLLAPDYAAEPGPQRPWLVLRRRAPAAP